MAKYYSKNEELHNFKLNMAVEEVVKERRTLKEAARQYKLEIDDIYVKTGIIAHLKNHPKMEPDYNNALKDVVYRRGTIKEIAAKYKVICTYLRIQVEYDTCSHTYFSLDDDLQLLQFLNATLNCTCQSCYKEELPSAAYTFAKKKHIKCSPWWKRNKRASYQWLKTFEERYTQILSKLPSDCKKESLCTPEEGKEQKKADQDRRVSDEFEIVITDEIPTTSKSMEEIESCMDKFEMLEIDRANYI